MSPTPKLEYQSPIKTLLPILLAATVAHADLPFRDGLLLHLDAASITAGPGSPIDHWPDTSGQNHHLTQLAATSRPTLDPSTGTVRFDGEDDVLTTTHLSPPASTLTVFAVVAPGSNTGGFRGFLATSELGHNDYTHGLNLGQGGAPTPSFSVLNAEGTGFQGQRDLMPDADFPFATFHHLTLTVTQKTVTLHIDGQPAATRPRDPAADPVGLDVLTLGSRYYANNAPRPFADGFFHGRIAELLVYSNALTEPQRSAVHAHLAKKHQTLTDPPTPSPDSRTRHVLERVENLPPVHFLVPGFTTSEIPLDLPNINNLKYRADGKLFASAYNGDVYLLSDTDDDGLEDHAHLWWDNQGRLRAPVGLDLTPPDYNYGDGIFIPSVGKVSLITDTDNDGTADKETVIADNWPPARQSVDAVGVAYDHRDGSVYFGLGTAMYNNAYLLDDQGVAQFDIGGELGTVMRIAPDFSSREIVSTGVRFSVGMAFNHLGDLFVSEQEGATWMAHGNAFDELLHILPDRHYGFPPRHPVHLPGVIDEPSTFDYGPQHQSLCGLLFNDPVKPGAPTFGPGWWRGDAFLVGESRGKLYRTKLTKTPHGYIAHNELVASIDGLATDAALSPDGALALAAHSGKPDWGTGPQGRGKLYKTTYSDPAIPQPVITFQSAPNEISVTYDRPLDPTTLTNLQQRTSIVSGEHVRAGDHYEPFHPGYKVINAQLAAPRYNVPVLAANLSPDHRTLSFETAPVTTPTHLALTIDGAAPTDLHTTTNGASATWTPAGTTSPTWSGWLPHLDLSVSPPILHQPLTEKGTLDIRAKLDLHHMLRPAVQPGETLDFNYPPEIVDLAFFSTTSPLTVTIDGETKSSTVGHTTHQVRFKRRSPSAAYLTSVAVRLHHPGGTTPPDLHLTFTTNEDNRQRPLARRRILNPWVQTGTSNTTTKPDLDPRLAGGDPARGRDLFFSEAVGCSRCHTAGDGGGTVGPDLSNLVHRDLDAVLRDITDPSAAINPDYVAYTVTTASGETLAGILRDPGDGTLLLGQSDGSWSPHPGSSLKIGAPLPVSLMPPALDKTLTKQQLADLLTYLLR